MPKCNNCGNNEHFRVSVKQEEFQRYNPETEELVEVEKGEHYETVEGPQCMSCDSFDVTMDVGYPEDDQ